MPELCSRECFYVLYVSAVTERLTCQADKFVSGMLVQGHIENSLKGQMGQKNWASWGTVCSVFLKSVWIVWSLEVLFIDWTKIVREDSFKKFYCFEKKNGGLPNSYQLLLWGNVYSIEPTLQWQSPSIMVMLAAVPIKAISTQNQLNKFDIELYPVTFGQGRQGRQDLTCHNGKNDNPKYYVVIFTQQFEL